MQFHNRVNADFRRPPLSDRRFSAMVGRPGEVPMDDDPRLILLDPRDTVFVLRGRLSAGETIMVGGDAVPVARDLPIAHKIARGAMKAGAKVLKYGAPIGVATADIARGEHVHVHNVRSDYTPTYTIDTAKGRSDGPGGTTE
jgi:altronate dehydratase small subunit